MGLNAAATIIPGKGTVFLAEPGTAFPDYLTLDPLKPPTGWDTLGHTSRDNNVALSKDGGDATVNGSWWAEALRTTYASTNWSLTANSLQIDKTTLATAFGGGVLDDAEGSYSVRQIVPQAKAVMVLMIDGTGRMAFGVPNTTVSVGEAPSIDPTKFFEVQLSFQILDDPTTGEKFRIFHPALKKAAAPAGSSAAASGGN